MPRFLIDANLPCRFDIWRGPGFQHVYDLNDAWSDSEVWRYAREHDLVIVSKDADFSDRIMLSTPPPRVVHLRIGNMRMRELDAFVRRVWPRVVELVQTHKLVIVHERLIECVA